MQACAFVETAVCALREDLSCSKCNPAQSRRHGVFGGLSPPKQSSKPQIEIWNTVNQWSFWQILECQAAAPGM